MIPPARLLIFDIDGVMLGNVEIAHIDEDHLWFGRVGPAIADGRIYVYAPNRLENGNMALTEIFFTSS